MNPKNAKLSRETFFCRLVLVLFQFYFNCAGTTRGVTWSSSAAIVDGGNYSSAHWAQTHHVPSSSCPSVHFPWRLNWLPLDIASDHRQVTAVGAIRLACRKHCCHWLDWCRHLWHLLPTKALVKRTFTPTTCNRRRIVDIFYTVTAARPWHRPPIALLRW